MQLPTRAKSTVAAHVLTLLILLPMVMSCNFDAATTTLESRDASRPSPRASSLAAAQADRSASSAAESPDDLTPGDLTPGDLTDAPPPSNETWPDPGRLLEKTFDDIKFDIEPDEPFDRSMLTREIENLAGKRIRIRGYILPTAQKRGVKQFVLVRDNQECCFGPGAALYDCILVTMNPGKSAEFSIRPVAVEGEFGIEQFKPLDRTLAVFHLKGEAVEAGK